jgi:hypothetical protein
MPPLPSFAQVWLWVFITIFAGVGAYLGSYLKKKGENFATKEDFNGLKGQTEELTRATKGIEARISHEFWNVQRRIALTRDLILDAVDTVGKAESCLKCAITECRRMLKNEPPSSLKNSYSECMEHSFTLDKMRFRVALIGGAQLIVRFIKMNKAYTDVLLTLNVRAFNEENVKTQYTAFQSALAEFAVAMRTELDVPLELDEEAIKFLSSGSSATPTLGSQAAD